MNLNSGPNEWRRQVTISAYLLPASILKADVFINLPKLKTHRKAGITGAMKNLVGINGSKDWLPHHTAGPREDGGDEYLHRSARKRLVSYLRDQIEGRKGALPRRALYLIERAVRSVGRPARFGGSGTLNSPERPSGVRGYHPIAKFADEGGFSAR